MWLRISSLSVQLQFPYRVYRVDATGSSPAPIKSHPHPQTISLRFVFILCPSQVRFRKLSLPWKLLHKYTENYEKPKSNTSLLSFHCARTVRYNSNAGAVHAQNRCFLSRSTLACAARRTSAHEKQTQSSNTFRVCTWPYQHSFAMTQLGTNISVTDM